jgi:hypothetical protein
MMSFRTPVNMPEQVYITWSENETKRTGSERRGNMTAGYRNEVVRFTQAATVMIVTVPEGTTSRLRKIWRSLLAISDQSA